MGHAYYMCRRYAEAVPPLREGASRSPNIRIIPLWLAAAYAQLGQLAEARVEAAEVLRIEPGFTIEKWKCTTVYKTPSISLTASAKQGCRKSEADLFHVGWPTS
jgi:hypothetical protein